MNINIRRFNLVVLFIIFLITATFILLYNLGWRYNLKQRSIIKTGVLTLKSTPRNALIYINNKDIRKETPAIIANLISGRYQIKLKKTGYYDWQKQIAVYPSLATIYDNIFLLKEPTGSDKIFNLPADNLVISPDASGAIIVVKYKNYSQLWFFDLQTWQSKKLYEVKDFEIKTVQWSSHSQNILILENSANKNNYKIINLQKTNRTIKLADIANYSYTNLKWDRSNDYILYGIDKDVIYKIDLATSSSIQIASVPSILDFFVDKNLVYAVSQRSFLYFDIKDPNKIIKITDLQQSTKQLFLDEQANLLPVLDQNNQILYLFDTDINLISTIKGVKIAVLSKSGDKLLYYNDFEIWIYDIRNNKHQMLTRISSKIKQAQWHPSLAYIIFSHNNTIQAIETDLYSPNLYDLLAVDVRQFALDKDGKNVLLLTNDGQLERINIF